MTIKQYRRWRAFIAWLIQFIIHSMCILGVLIAMAGLAIVEQDFSVPMWVCIAHFAFGALLFSVSLYSYHKIYMEE